MRTHILPGLEPDNLLAFLALLGFHRAVEQARPEWGPRVCWYGTPLRPRMVLSTEVSQSDLLEAGSQGCESLAAVHEFNGRKDIDYTAEEARETLLNACDPANRMLGELMAALMSDAAVKKAAKNEPSRVRATPFCTIFGQGHQHFLERLRSVPQGEVPKELAKEMSPADLNSAVKLEQALFRTWERSDKTQSFRWDPAEDRRYALRFEDPSNDRGLTVHGANRLACLALPLFPAVPCKERGEVRLYAIGTSWEGARLCVRWPTWNRPASLQVIMRMIAACSDEESCPGAGITGVYQAERVSIGKFFNFTRATSLTERSRDL